MHVTPDWDWDCVQLAVPVAALFAALAVESMAEMCNHGVMTELAFADAMMLIDPWLVNLRSRENNSFTPWTTELKFKCVLMQDR